ncbi:hypothetical protein A3K73_01630 [Candidatus Pacearchaeota archaeon RBG_13_36_9]|nr:MAG: hypothetical protein A3K73_01630 [Candidatus Pacearchaeota archaeon RBG_13_36_9]
MNKVQLPQPTLIFVAGGPGIGKTTLIDGLALRISSVCFVLKDAVGDPMLRSHLPGERGTLSGLRIDMASEFYKTHLRDQIYYSLLDLGITNLSRGLSPFIEGNYTGGIKNGYFQRVAFPYLEEKGFGKFRRKMLFCYAPLETIAKRLKVRNAPRDAEKLASEEALQKYMSNQNWLPSNLDEDFPGNLVVDTSKSLKENTERAMGYLMRDERSLNF